jgi:hypothetical protein
VLRIYPAGLDAVLEVDLPEAARASSPPKGHCRRAASRTAGSPSTRGTQPQTKRPARSTSATPGNCRSAIDRAMPSCGRLPTASGAPPSGVGQADRAQHSRRPLPTRMPRRPARRRPQPGSSVRSSPMKTGRGCPPSARARHQRRTASPLSPAGTRSSTIILPCWTARPCLSAIAWARRLTGSSRIGATR